MSEARGARQEIIPKRKTKETEKKKKKKKREKKRAQKNRRISSPISSYSDLRITPWSGGPRQFGIGLPSSPLSPPLRPLSRL